jgi:hypothetical protein
VRFMAEPRMASISQTRRSRSRLYRATLFYRAEQFQSEYVMHFAGSGDQALERLADEFEPTLIAVLSDINMPGMVALTSFSAEPLPEQDGHIGLVVHHQDTHTHDAASPNIVRCLRGNRTVNSVNSPTRLSTSIAPPCCWVTMS